MSRAGRESPAGGATGATGWLLAAVSAAAVGAYLYRHRELAAAPLAALAEVLLGGSAGLIGLLWLPALTLGALALALWPWTALYDRRPGVRLLASLLATSALVVLLQQALGAAGLLRRWPLLAAALLAAAALAVAAGRWAPAGAWRLRASAPRPFGLVLALWTGAVYLAMVAVAALVPPFGWDTLVYHLTDVFYSAQTGRLAPFPYPGVQFAFPQVGELHALWFYLLSGAAADSWRVTGIALAPLALTAGLALRTAARALELRRASSWIGAAVMLTPLMLIQPLAGYVDAVFAAFLLAGFAFTLLAAREGRPAHLAFAALAAGLAMGAKISFVYYGLPLLLVLASPAALRSLLGGRPRAVAARLAVWLALFLVGHGYWTVGNLVRHGNPFHPIEVAVGSHTLLEGAARIEPESDDHERFVDGAAGWLAYPFAETFKGRLQYTTENGLGPLFAAGLVAWPLVLALAVRERRWLETRALLALPTALAAWLALSPWQHPRYVLHAVGFALLALAGAAERVGRGASGAGRRPLPIPRALMAGSVAAALLFSAVAGLGGIRDLREAVARWRSGEWQPQDYYRLHYGAAGEAFNWISERIEPGATLSLNRGDFVAPLFGWHGRNRVVFAATLEHPVWDGAPFAGSAGEWLGFLERSDVGWLVVWHSWWDADVPASAAERWMERSPESFRAAARFEGRASVYEVDPGPALAGKRRGAERRLDELAAADRWRVEYARGAEGRLADEPGGGLRIDYSFSTDDNDYLDLRLGLSEGSWPRRGRLVFDLEAAPRPTLLFVYLKEADPRRQCRFRVDLERRGGAAGPVELDLSAPEWRKGDFDPRRVAEVHLVLDDAVDRQSFDGSLRIDGFRLLPAEETTTTEETT